MRTWFSIDPRSLALFRMVLGVLLLADLFVRATDLDAMYTDDGMFSRAEICRRATSIWNWSFHFGGGSWGYQAMLFGIAAVLALALLGGFETRLVTIGSWLMLVSVHHRVPPILSGAENLLRMLLFWAMFLPLGRAWSLDGWLAQRRGQTLRKDEPSPVLSVATAAVLLQMGFVYLFSAIFKSNEAWWRGEAIAGVLAHSFYASPPAAYLLHFPQLMKVMTWGTFALEWAAPFLLFCPRFTARVRLGLIAALGAMHLGIGILLEVGLFSYVSLAGLVLFVPPEFWNSGPLARFLGTSAVGGPVAEPARPLARKSSPVHYATQAFCLLMLLYMCALNLNSLPSLPLAPWTPEKWRPLTRGLGFSQMWGMFGSVPSKDGWYVARAKLQDGSEVDLLRQGALVDWRKPEFPARNYPNYYWQKIFREMAYDDEQGFQLFRVPVARFLCRRWNKLHPEDKQIAEFELIYCTLTQTRRGDITVSELSREPLARLDLSGS
ncbi:MAG TPA: HTTM domain-containing protein [Verrucomicrobiae bacterium]|nr:HTTM domain-containing protein [Verrucomicrobiae bacterium]